MRRRYRTTPDTLARLAAIRRALPPSAGFNVTYLCDQRNRDCRYGSCWHMASLRECIHRWFLRLVPTRVYPWREPPVCRYCGSTAREVHDDQNAFCGDCGAKWEAS